MSDMIRLFNIPKYKIDATKFDNLLYGPRVRDFEEEFAEYVGARCAVACNSASSIIYLLCKYFQFDNKKHKITIPSRVPIVVKNMLDLSDSEYEIDKFNLNWMGYWYILMIVGRGKSHNLIVDSAHDVMRHGYCSTTEYAKFYSFYPTKPVGGIDGGMLVSDSMDLIENIRMLATNGIEGVPGYKMYMNSLQAEWASRSLKHLEAKKMRLAEINEQYNSAFGMDRKVSDHLYVINIKGYLIDSNDEDNIINSLKKRGIESKVHYHDVVRSCNNLTKVFSIPYHEALTQKEIDKVIEEVKPWIS